MQSPNLDETSPTFRAPGSESRANHTGPEEQDSGVSRRAPDSAQVSGGDESHVSHPPTKSEQLNPPESRSLSETQPAILKDEGANLPAEIPAEPPETPHRKGKWILWAMVGVLLLVSIAVGSAYAGYNSAVDQRNQYQATQVAGEAANQYILAQQDIALGNYDRARQRLEYLIKIDPNYPNASEQLAYVLTQQRITATPTQAPTPSLTPTPDYRGRDDLFAQAQNSLVSRDWTASIDTLLLLRKNYPDFMAVQVDDMLFVALRNRGIDKIAQQHDLEGGNYDLTLAERFGPLDSEANNWRTWADLYIRGASFWDVDWGQAVYYFSQLADAVPNLSDSSGWTAANRYRDALLGYGDWYAAQGKWCEAQAQYDIYMSLLADPKVEPTAMYAFDQCQQGTSVPSTPSSETPTPSGEPPTPAGETPTPTATQQPSGTPYP
jgi:tetratricopeptide (TPR) repeat protein